MEWLLKPCHFSASRGGRAQRWICSESHDWVILCTIGGYLKFGKFQCILGNFQRKFFNNWNNLDVHNVFCGLECLTKLLYNFCWLSWKMKSEGMKSRDQWMEGIVQDSSSIANGPPSSSKQLTGDFSWCLVIELPCWIIMWRCVLRWVYTFQKCCAALIK